MIESIPVPVPADWSDPLLVISQPHFPDPQFAIAAVRAGALGLVDLSGPCPADGRRTAVDRLRRFVGESASWGVGWDMLGRHADGLDGIAELSDGPFPLLLLSGVDFQRTGAGDVLRRSKKLARRVLVEVYTPAGAMAAERAGFDGLVLKGHESGGRVGLHTTFIFLQHVRGKLRVPYWARGGISSHTAPAAVLAGATGVALCEQLWLARESPLAPDQRRQLEHCDGSETVLLGVAPHAYRYFGRCGRSTLRELTELWQAGGDWFGPMKRRLLSPADEHQEGGRACLVAAGEDLAFAADLARRDLTVSRILARFRASLAETIPLAAAQATLSADGPLAKSLESKYPVLQGPMTRVSDESSFCEAVADAGGMPFLALGLMHADEVRRRLGEARSRLEGRPWGVGILAFMPPTFLAPQLEVVRGLCPPLAILAGGRPEQAAALEECGVRAYVHVPSPGVLEAFLRQGLRRIVLEGRECGGHVGPRSSFTLWSSAVDVLLASDVDDPAQLEVLFAGGIHDRHSAAMVAAVAAPLVRRGIKVGLLMGTAS